MKKQISVLLALLMVLSVFAFAAAAEDTEVPVEETPVEDPVEETPVEEVVESAEEPVETPAEELEAPVEETPAAEEIVVETPAEEAVAEETAEVTTEAPVEETTEAPAEEAAETPAEETAEPLIELTPEEEEAAGTTPDSPIMWGLDRAMERISLALTFGKSAKAKRGLAHALERHAEIKAMIAQKRFAEAEAAQEVQAENLAEVQENVDGIDSSDAAEDLADVEEVEAGVEELQAETEELQNEIKVKVKGQLTEDQQAKLDALIESLKDSTGKVEVKVQAKKNKVQVKVKLVEEKEGGGKKVTVTHTDLYKRSKESASAEEGQEVTSKGKDKSAEESATEPTETEKPVQEKGAKGKK
jgi:hypothetical protein